MTKNGILALSAALTGFTLVVVGAVSSRALTPNAPPPATTGGASRDELVPRAVVEAREAEYRRLLAEAEARLRVRAEASATAEVPTAPGPAFAGPVAAHDNDGEDEDDGEGEDEHEGSKEHHGEHGHEGKHHD
jgi:hypothetical protein